MKKTLFAILALVLSATACHKPEYIEPTAERQGLTSLTAIFTFGPYVDQEMAKLTIEDDAAERFVIPIPFYFPATSDSPTLAYMTKVRVQAELQPNFTIEPALGILDLTEENVFTYTNPKGVSKKIIITGERVKSSECDILSFTLSNPNVGGVVNKEKKTVILPTRDDVSKATATVLLSSHATIFPDPTKARDYSNPVKFTVTAHDGSKAEYTVQTGDPEKIDFGFNASSLEKLFNFDPVSRLGLPDYSTNAPVSLAAIQGKLIISTGSGAPLIIDGLTGEKKGTIKTGSANVGSITNDEMEHMLLVNIAQGGDSREMVNIYKTSSVSTDPELFYSFENPLAVPVGHKMKVLGDIEKDAVIVLTSEGIAGITLASEAIYIPVKDGQATGFNVVNFASVTPGWGEAPVNMATVVAASTTPDKDGWYYSYYGDNTDGEAYLLHYMDAKGSDTVIARVGNWANNPNCLDSKSFNNARYMTLFVPSHFPCWGIGPMIYLYNITDPAAPAIEFSNESIGWYQQGTYAGASGDVVVSPAADGYKMFVYYYDNNSQVVGGYSVDCIKR